MNITIENRFAEKIVEVSLVEAELMDSSCLAALQKKWTSNLLKWHSPYTALLDLGGARVAPELAPDLERFFRMLKGFHMRKLGVCGCGDEATAEIFGKLAKATAATRPELLSAMKLDSLLTVREGHIPSLIRVESFFEDQYMEVSLVRPGEFSTAEDVAELKRRFEALLRQWHTGYAVVFDLTQMRVAEAAWKDFEALIRFLKGFFCRSVVGHSAPRGVRFPFPTFASRHQALEEVMRHRDLGTGKSSMNCSRQDFTLGATAN